MTFFEVISIDNVRSAFSIYDIWGEVRDNIIEEMVEEGFFSNPDDANLAKKIAYPREVAVPLTIAASKYKFALGIVKLNQLLSSESKDPLSFSKERYIEVLQSIREANPDKPIAAIIGQLVMQIKRDRETDLYVVDETSGELFNYVKDLIRQQQLFTMMMNMETIFPDPEERARLMQTILIDEDNNTFVLNEGAENVVGSYRQAYQVADQNFRNVVADHLESRLGVQRQIALDQALGNVLTAAFERIKKEYDEKEIKKTLSPLGFRKGDPFSENFYSHLMSLLVGTPLAEITEDKVYHILNDLFPGE